MDVATAGKDFLSEFVESLGTDLVQEEIKIVDEDISVSTGVEVNQSDNVWLDIREASRRWSDRILDTERRFEKTVSFRENIEASLQRQQLDGFLNHQDIAELRYIADLWANLLNCTSSYTIGCDFVKRDIITYLLELYKLRQITDSLFIEACLRL